MSDRLILLAVFEGAGVLLILTSIPLLRRKVKPNIWYGVRTGATLRNERVWYEVNARFARAFIVVSVLLMALTPILYAIPAVSTETLGFVTVVSLLLVLFGLTMWVLKLGEDLSREQPRDEQSQTR